MPLITFPFGDSPGIARDIEPYRLPAGIWSDGRNMLFKERRAVKAFGWETFISSLTIAARGLFFCPLNSEALWIYPGLADVRAFDIEGTTAEITRVSGDYTGGEFNKWTFAYLHGLGILNNGADTPQLWSPPSLATKLVDLTNWPASTTARTVRSFLNFLIALDVTKSGTRHAAMVKWSHLADAGAVPSSWDETDATKQAGENVLSETPGACIDCLPLGSSNIIYKEDSVYGMNFVGGRFIFAFQRLILPFGALTQDCVALVERQHFVATNDDIVLHDGINAKSLVNEKDRNFIFDNLTTIGKENSFVVPYSSRKEVWFCFPGLGETVPSLAMIWNRERDSIAFRDLPRARAIAYAPAMRITATADTWDGDAATTWASETAQTWNDISFVGFENRVLMLDEVNSQVAELKDDVFDADGTAERSYLERQSMPFGNTDDKGNALVDLRLVKFVQEIWPHITGTSGVIISVYVGTQMEFEEAIDWLDPINFIIGTTNFIPVYKSCRFLSIRFEATGSDQWELHGFTYSLEPMGKF